MDKGLRMLAVLSFQFPLVVLAVWIVLVTFFGCFVPKLPHVLKDHGLLAHGTYSQVQRILVSDFQLPDNPVILVFENSQHVSTDRFREGIEGALQRVQGTDGLLETVSPLERPDMLDGDHAYALLVFRQPAYEMEPVLAKLDRRLPHRSDITVRVTGKSVVQADVNRMSRKDLQQAERIGIPAAMLVLWLAFGGFIVAILPVAVGVAGVTAAMGMMVFIGMKLELSNFVLNVIPMVGLALSIDYALMIVSRYREELVWRPAEAALTVAMQTAGRAVLFSAAVVCFGLLAVLFIPLPMFASIAIGALTVLAVSVAATLTLLPALLVLFRRGIRAVSGASPAVRRAARWRAWPQFVLRRPLRVMLLAAVILFVCFLPLKDMEVAIPDASSLPKGNDSRQAAEAYQTHFESADSSLVYVLAQAQGKEWTPDDWRRANALVRSLRGDPGVERVDDVFTRLRLTPEQLDALVRQPAVMKRFEPTLKPFMQSGRMLIAVTIEGAPSSKQAADWVRSSQNRYSSSQMPVLVGGEAKYRQEVFDAIFGNIGKVIWFLAISNFIVLFAAFRSVIIPLKTIAMNIMSIGASFGILVWLFGSGRFGLEPAPIAIMIPVFIFGLVFGISMDYGVFLISRMYESYRRTLCNEEAVLDGVAGSGPIITSAAAIMIAVTLPFAFGEVQGVKQLGIGIAAAILIDATVIRLMLVPSLMKWLGKWNWWAPG
ncbi:MMPL family transporter [Paenibacillus cymbidii]|uniref:MMPL family transporter n=1 Tax=Paenibacillus cymbidii TaxID=1639034 RepID=UPI001080C219|nr:MMPL family transporter [Paenibacillus cymbidii]